MTCVSLFDFKRPTGAQGAARCEGENCDEGAAWPHQPCSVYRAEHQCEHANMLYNCAWNETVVSAGVGVRKEGKCEQEQRRDEKTLRLANDWTLTYSGVGNGKRVPQRVEGFICIKPTVRIALSGGDDDSDDLDDGGNTRYAGDYPGDNNQEKWEGHNGRTIAEVGSSQEQVKTITVPVNFPECPARVDTSNWLDDDIDGYSYNDSNDNFPVYFLVKRLDETTLTVTRDRGEKQGMVWRQFQVLRFFVFFVFAQQAT